MDTIQKDGYERPYRKQIYQTADRLVSKAKFQKEVEIFKASAASYRARGIFILSADFPDVYVLFTAHHLNPASVIFAVKFNYTNYDASPPSVVFVNPFTLEPIPFGEMVTRFPKLVGFVGNHPQRQDLLQGYGPHDIPFLCMEGVREYHLHPAHTGNSWFLHRGRGKGTLGFLIDQIYEYGTLSLVAHNVQFFLAGYQLSVRQ